ncbi:MAG: hypothetical protein H8E86_01440 [Planctomycetes bacterium]|nr:hypothetical protein [Planctomycetota bacterium]
MNTSTNNKPTNGNTTLWATTFFIAALIFVMAGRHTSKAAANSANTSDGITLLTTSNGQGSEFLHVIDNSTSMYMVYFVKDPQNNPSLEVKATWFLPAMFNSTQN